MTPPPVTPPGERGAAPDAAATRGLLCSSSVKPENLLVSALGGDPASALNTLYVPRDATDAKAKASMLGALKDAPRLRVTAHTIRSEAAGEGCDWVMVLDANYAASFGTSRKRSWQVMVQLEAPAGSPRVKQIFGATDAK